MEAEELLSADIEALDFDTEFCKSCRAMNLRTLRDITEISPDELIIRKGFSYNWLRELISYLDKKELLHLLQNP